MAAKTSLGFAAVLLARTALVIVWPAFHPAQAALTEHANVLVRRSSKPSSRRPLVLIPGFAQSIVTYESHLPSLSRERDVLVFQPLGLGKNPPAAWLNNANVSLPAQAEQLASAVDRAFPDSNRRVDVAGFSLGGRIALCAACLFPRTISRLHLTGVALEPTRFAQESYQAWQELLRRDGDRRPDRLARHILEASFHPQFLSANRGRLQSWADALCDSHTPSGLLAVLEQTHRRDEWSVAAAAQKLRRARMAAGDAARPLATRLCVGSDDRLAGLSGVRELAEALGGRVTAVPECGHAVPVEAPRAWRNSLLQFLDGLEEEEEKKEGGPWELTSTS